MLNVHYFGQYGTKVVKEVYAKLSVNSLLSIIDWTTMFEEVSDTRTTFCAYRTHSTEYPFM